MKFLFSFFIVTFFNFNLMADDWSHAHLQAKDGTKISIDFQYHHNEGGTGPQGYVATPVWINVENPQIIPSITGFVDLTNFVRSNYTYAAARCTATLISAGGHRLTGQLFCPFRMDLQIGKSKRATANETYFQRIEISLAGWFLLDPWNNTRGFNLSLADAAQLKY
jgi:hypothetical protein